MAHYEFTFSDKIRTLQFLKELNNDLQKEGQNLLTRDELIQSRFIELGTLINDCDDPTEYIQEIMMLVEEYEKLEKECMDHVAKTELVHKLVVAAKPILTN